MKKTTENSEMKNYREGQRRYLDASKVYAAALTKINELNPHILGVVRDIHETGATLSQYDSHTLTSFYNDLQRNSRIDKTYKIAYQNLIKARATLEQASYKLSEARFEMILEKAGIVKVRHNRDKLAQVQWVNNPRASALERISVALPYLREEILKLETYIDKGEIKISEGEIKATSRDARNFVRQLENLAIRRVNDQYFSRQQKGLRELYPQVTAGKLNTLELIRDLGDPEHVRELERRIGAGDVAFTKDDLAILTEKGARYQRLLNEELKAKTERMIEADLVRAHDEAVSGDALLLEISTSVDTLTSGVAKHLDRIQSLDFENGYSQLTREAEKHSQGLRHEKDALFADLENLANAAVALRKQLLVYSDTKQIDTERALSILAGMRMLENYEDKVGLKLRSFSEKLGIVTPASDSNAVTPLTEIYEKYLGSQPELSGNQVSVELPQRLQARYQFRSDLVGIIAKFITGSQKYKLYQEVVLREKALTDYLFDYLSDRPKLHQGAAEIAQVLSEIIETQIEKEELLSEVIHEVELTHKKLWLADVKKGNTEHIEKNIRPVSLSSAKTAHETNVRIVTEGEKNIENLLQGFSIRHDEHAKEFLAELSKLPTRIKSGESAANVSADIKAKYRKYYTAHKQELASLEVEMQRLDRVLSTLSSKSRKVIEKTLIDDIKKKALS